MNEEVKQKSEEWILNRRGKRHGIHILYKEEGRVEKF